MRFWKICLALIVSGAIICCAFLYSGVLEERKPSETNSASESNATAEKTEDNRPLSSVLNATHFCLNPPTYEPDTKDNSADSSVALERGSEIMEIALKAIEKLRDREPEEPGVTRGELEKGDTISEILDKVAAANSRHYLKEADKLLPLRRFRAGRPYSLVTDPETGLLKRFEYEINDSKRLVVEGTENPRGRLEDIEYEWRLDSVDGYINGSLFQAVADAGESPNLAVKLVKLFGSEINFAKHIQDGDSFSVLIEKRYRGGEYKGYGRILAASFTNRDKRFEAFLFYDADGRPQYYNRKGENIHKTFLQSPLSVTRVTSRFAQKRMHPILGYARAHLGVDYGAPLGTPVKSVGAGKVVSRGWAGGYGNQVVIRHGNGMESLYNHLSGFSRGLSVGQKVTQGQVIGFVGSTGLSTGPHLDFRLRINDVFLDPAKAINPRAEPV
ncbi:MAG: peptidoglycan DD-metalloendopeptidase family protein, partial [Desulfovibrio sp.]|nr:peptidoglycan DD-metalloendopeptidase family protein [Desulfovibrio sp.]